MAHRASSAFHSTTRSAALDSGKCLHYLPARGSSRSELARCFWPSKPPMQIMLPFSTEEASAKRGVLIGLHMLILSATGSNLEDSKVTHLLFIGF